MSRHPTDSDQPHPPLGHVVPLPVLVLTLLVLLALTGLTVGVTVLPWMNLGRLGNLWVALLIATVKATLVALYFMHLRYEKPIIAIILCVTLAFVILFVGLTLKDTREYQPSIQTYRAADPTRYAPDLYNK